VRGKTLVPSGIREDTAADLATGMVRQGVDIDVRITVANIREEL